MTFPRLAKSYSIFFATRITRLRTTVHLEFGPNITSYNDRWLLPGLPSYFNLLQPPSEAAVLEALHIVTRAMNSLSRMPARFCCRWPPGRRGFIPGLRRMDTGPIILSESSHRILRSLRI